MEISDVAFEAMLANNGDFEGEIIRVKDVCDYKSLLEALGDDAIDIYIAGPPCNDLAGSNPRREVRRALAARDPALRRSLAGQRRAQDEDVKVGGPGRQADQAAAEETKKQKIHHTRRKRTIRRL